MFKSLLKKLFPNTVFIVMSRNDYIIVAAGSLYLLDLIQNHDNESTNEHIERVKKAHDKISSYL